jgi:hypothetical protein
MTLKLTDAGLSALLDFLDQGVTGSPTSPGGWLTLFTTGPSASGAGDVEVGGYSRIQLASWAHSGSWPTRTSTMIGSYVFAGMPACTVTGWGISSDATGGTLLAFEPFVTPVSFSSGDNYSVPNGSIYTTLST